MAFFRFLVQIAKDVFEVFHQLIENRNAFIIGFPSSFLEIEYRLMLAHMTDLELCIFAGM